MSRSEIIEWLLAAAIGCADMNTPTRHHLSEMCLNAADVIESGTREDVQYLADFHREYARWMFQVSPSSRFPWTILHARVRTVVAWFLHLALEAT